MCPNCFFIFDKNGGESTTCHICSDLKRRRTVICVVEKETDILAIEKTGHYDGVYHILGGNIYTTQDSQEEGFLLKNLKDRIVKLIDSGAPKSDIELIFAINPTPDGDATVSFLLRNLSDLNLKTTRLARGLPRGADLEYADQDTLMHAIQNRN